MKVHQIFTGNDLRNFSYLIQCSEKEFYCVDPWDGEDTLAVIEDMGGELKAIINTHEHDDHTRGNSFLVEKTGCEIWAHENADGKIDGVNRFLKKGDLLELGDGTFEVMDTPGHTNAHLCLLLREGSEPIAVFTGDTLFNAGVGNCHGGGDPEVLYETIKNQFQNLPDNVLVYPGHEYLGNNLKFTLSREPSNEKAKELYSVWSETDFSKEYLFTNMGLEREVNTFLRLNNEEIIAGLTGDRSDDKQTFLRLRELRNTW